MSEKNGDFRIKVTPNVNFANGQIHLKEEIGFEKAKNSLINTIIDTKNKAVRVGLVRLGWIPPEQGDIMMGMLDFLVEEIESHSKDTHLEIVENKKLEEIKQLLKDMKP